MNNSELKIKFRFQQTAGGTLVEQFVRGCIRLKTGDSLTHCCVILPDGIVDANHRHGVSKRVDSDRLLKFEIIETSIPVRSFLLWVEPRLGLPFDFLGMVSHLWGGRIKVLGAYYCSSLISEFLAYYFQEVEKKALCSSSLRKKVARISLSMSNPGIREGV